MTKIYISNIVSDKLKTDGRACVTALGLHELICDRRIETSKKPEKNVTSILNAIEYSSVIENGYYTVDD